MNVRDLVLRLRGAPVDASRFEICTRLERCFLARSPSGRPAVLVPCNESTPAAVGRATGAILVRYQSQVAFDVEGHSWTAPAVVLECLDDGVLHTFIALALDLDAQLAASAPAPTVAAVLRALATWERLLRSRTALSEERQVGLWGELEFIRSAPSVDGAIRAWNPDPAGTIDFVAGGTGIEVKTTTTRLRHAMSHRQGQAADGNVRLLVASLWVVHDAVGRSLAGLVDAIGECTAETVAFEQKLLAAGFSRRDADAYSRRFAVGAPFLFFAATSLPRIRPFDAGISSIRYVVELDASDALPDDQARAAVAAVTAAPLA